MSIQDQEASSFLEAVLSAITYIKSLYNHSPDHLGFARELMGELDKLAAQCNKTIEEGCNESHLQSIQTRLGELVKECKMLESGIKEVLDDGSPSKETT